MKLLVDNDVVIKLSQLDLYSAFLRSHSLEASSVGSLGVMLRYMGRTSHAARLRLTKSVAEADRLEKVLLSLEIVEPDKAEQELAARLMKLVLQADLDIQEGELTLFTLAVSRSGTKVATGDKRAVVALPKLASLEALVLGLKGRIECFEQIVAAVAILVGLAGIRKAVAGARHADGSLTKTFDYFESRGLKQFLKGLQIVIEDRVGNSCPGWLVSAPAI